MRKINILYLFLIVAITSCVIGCKKMDDTYRQFVEDGETVYVARADSIKAHSGENRIELTWLLLSDPKVRSYKVYWDSRSDSLEGNVQKTDEVDTIRVMVNNLDEGVHYFEVYMFGEGGTKSVQTEVIGHSYGDIYKNSLLPRIVRNAEWAPGSSITLELTNASEDAVRTEFEYLDRTTGELTTQFVSSDAEIDTLPNVKAVENEAEIKYRTVFLPDSTAIDTFYSEYSTMTLVKTGLEVDKSGFAILPLDNDAWESHYANRAPELMWDGSTTSSPYATVKADMPSSFAIDLGKTVDLTKFRWNDYSGGNNYAYFYNRGTPIHFEVWGSNDPTEDGDWSKWTKLGTYEIKRPSGLPRGEDLTQEDIDRGIEGHEFTFDESQDNNYRYIRFKVFDVWQGTDPYHVWVGELTFWAFP